MNESRRHLHLFLACLFAAFVAVLFLKQPGFGDDLTYWTAAFHMHENGLAAWHKGSFHDLRWPVWGVIWLVQCVTGPGLISFYAEPVVYLMAGAALSFTFARLATRSIHLAWAAAMAFLLHPLLDTVSYRPMPDLSEGVWGAAAIYFWWRLMNCVNRERMVLWAIALGACVFVSETNRFTGLFIVPVLLVCTFLFARKRFGWICVALGFATFFYLLECMFYGYLFRDLLHSIHANIGAKGHKGTEEIDLWRLPIRFVPIIFKGSVLAPVYAVAAIAGGIAACLGWRPKDPALTSEETPLIRREELAKVMAVWAVLLFLEYSCAPQKIWPWRPMIRDADRFLCGMLVPMSVLMVIGAAWFARLPKIAYFRPLRWLRDHPSATLAAAGLAMLASTAMERGFYSLGYIPELQSYLRSRPDETKIFTHRMMRSVAYLAEAKASARLNWIAPREILSYSPEEERSAAKADEFWYARKLLWLNSRKGLQKRTDVDSLQFASYIANPEKEWVISKLITKGDNPDFVFYKKRTPTDAPPTIIDAQAAMTAGYIPKLPCKWDGKTGPREREWTIKVPEGLRGHAVRVEMIAASPLVESLLFRFEFVHDGKIDAVYEMNPYLQQIPALEFFAFQIPSVSTECRVISRLNQKAKFVEFTDFRMVVEPLR